MRHAAKLCTVAVIGIVIAAFVGCGRKTAAPSPFIPVRPDLSSWPKSFSAALGEAEDHIRRDQSPEAGLGRLAELYRVNGFYDQAIDCYRNLATLQPNEPRWPHILAGILASFGRLQEALPLQQRAASLAPTNVVCQIRLGDMQLKSNHLTEAVATYESALKLDDGNSYALLGLARCAIANNRWDEARTYLGRMVKSRPRFPGLWDLLTTVHEHFGEKEAAEGARRAAGVIGRFRDIFDPWEKGAIADCFDAYQLSVSAAQATDNADARERLGRAIELAPENAAYHRQLAKLLEKDRDIAGARELLEQAVKLSEHDAESWAALIDLLVKSQDRPAADKAIDRALQLCPQSAYVHFVDGLRLAEQKKFAEAEGAFKSAIKIQPNEARAYVQLSAIFVQQSRLEDALAAIKAARAAEPGNPAVLVLVANLSIALNDESSARDTIDQLRKAPGAFQADLSAVEAYYRKEFGHDPQ